MCKVQVNIVIGNLNGLMNYEYKLLPTMYKNNSGLIAKTKVIKYKKGLCLNEKLAF